MDVAGTEGTGVFWDLEIKTWDLEIKTWNMGGENISIVAVSVGVNRQSMVVVGPNVPVPRVTLAPNRRMSPLQILTAVPVSQRSPPVTAAAASRF
jgi:hypothetical protein